MSVVGAAMDRTTHETPLHCIAHHRIICSGDATIHSFENEMESIPMLVHKRQPGTHKRLIDSTQILCFFSAILCGSIPRH